MNTISNSQGDDVSDTSSRGHAALTVEGSASDPIIEIVNVHKWFGHLHVLNDINMEVRRGEKIVVCGPSG